MYTLYSRFSVSLKRQKLIFRCMVLYTTKPIKEFSTEECKYLVYDKRIEISSHAYDYLSTEERKVFKEEELIAMIKKETPRKVYLQENGRYALYYRKEDGFRKLIIDIKEEKAVIVTFMDTDEIPKIRI